MKASEITPEFQKKGFNNFKVKGRPQTIQKAHRTAVTFYKKYDAIKTLRSNSIALTGSPGSGKTHLLMAIANNMINEKQIRVMYFPYREGFDDLKDDWDAVEAKRERMKKIDVLFLDDLFKGEPTDFEIKTMYSIVNYRYLNSKPMLISSEYHMGQILGFDEALGSRIYEMTKDYYVKLEGDRWDMNYRLK